MNQNNINEKDKQVLQIVAQNEPVRSKTITETLYWADSTKDTNYRLQKLEGNGLIEREEVEDSQYPVNPKQAWITENGHSELTDIEESQPRGIEERVTRVEKKVGAMTTTYGQVKQRLVELENTVDDLETEHETEYEELSQQITELRRTIDADDDITISPEDFSFWFRDHFNYNRTSTTLTPSLPKGLENPCTRCFEWMVVAVIPKHDATNNWKE